MFKSSSSVPAAFKIILHYLVGLWAVIREKRRRAIVYIILAVCTLIWEMNVGFLEFLTSGSGHGISVPGKLYQWFATAGHRKPRPHFVGIIVLSPMREPAEIFGDVCRKREFVSAVLDKIELVSPAGVILDFYYSAQSCNGSDDEPRSHKLEAAVRRAADRFPVVIGSNTYTKRELERLSDPDLPQLIKAGLTDTGLILDSGYNFSGKHLSYGLVRVDVDTRQVPIFWPVFRDKNALLNHLPPERMPSLAYAAAVTHDPGIEKLLAKINRDDIHPFTTLIPEPEFKPVNAIDLLCAHYKQGDDWRHCQPPSATDNLQFDGIRQKIVVISEHNLRSDFSDSVVGNVPGYVLQANYIESLLDDRYLRSIPFFWEVVWTLLGTVIVLVVFETQNPLIAVVEAIIMIAVVTGGCNLLATYLGKLIVFWFPLATIVIIELALTVRTSILDFGSDRETPLSEYSSCFIRYAVNDYQFAERLYADLHARGVRCLFAPEETGKGFRQSVKGDGHFHETLLVVLSENSVNSNWLQEEVEAAFSREENESKLLLISVRLDDAIFSIDKPWAARLRGTRDINDFSKWRDQDLYKEKLERLLRDIRGKKEGSGVRHTLVKKSTEYSA